MGPQHTFNSPHLLPTLTFPYISPYLPHTPSHFSTPFIPLPTSLLPPPTPQHIFLLSPHLPSPSQSVAKLPCDEVCVAKLLWRSYHVAKLLATLIKYIWFCVNCQNIFPTFSILQQKKSLFPYSFPVGKHHYKIPHYFPTAWEPC